MLRLIMTLGLAVPAAAQVPDSPNVLLIIADDLGYDLVGAYAGHDEPATTPMIDQLAADGMMFGAAYSDPVCSPSRVGLMTGHYGSDHLPGMARSHFVGAPVFWDCTENASFGGAPIAPIDLPFIPALAPATYRTGMVGKLHWDHEFEGEYEQPACLDPRDPCNADPAVTSGNRNYDSAIKRGFERYAGAPNGGLGKESASCGYFDYSHIVASDSAPTVITNKTTYITSQEVDDALAMIRDFSAEPWFVTVSFHAPHRPFHAPPPALHTLDEMDVAAAVEYLQDNPGALGSSEYAVNARLAIRAMTEALDTEIGRLLGSMPPGELEQTIVLLVSDNGTPSPTFDDDDDGYTLNGAKGDVYEGGVRVPFIVKGPGVPRVAEPMQQLVNLQDIHATVLDLMGGSVSPPTPSVSIVPYFADPGLDSLRLAVYSRRHNQNGPPPGLIEGTRDPDPESYGLIREMARVGPFKLIRRKSGGSTVDEEFYNLDWSPDESFTIDVCTPGQLAAYTFLDGLLATKPTTPPILMPTGCPP